MQKSPDPAKHMTSLGNPPAALTVPIVRIGLFHLFPTAPRA
jgi:hypothetical protein